MDDWIKFDWETSHPPVKDPTDGAKWYDVMLVDGTETTLCWWLGGWYCTVDRFNVAYWKNPPKTYS